MVAAGISGEPGKNSIEIGETRKAPEGMLSFVYSLRKADS